MQKAPIQHHAMPRLHEAVGVGPALVGFLDVDGLMMINQTEGREAGDRLLAVVSTVMQEWANEAADRVVEQLNGDEFGFVLPGRTLEEGFLASEELRRRIVDREDGPAVTIGVAHLPRDGSSLDDVWRAAEVACWLAKESGGNRVGLPAKDEMVLKSCYYPSSSLGRLRALSERLGRKESELFREALELLLSRYTQRPNTEVGPEIT